MIQQEVCKGFQVHTRFSSAYSLSQSCSEKTSNGLYVKMALTLEEKIQNQIQILGFCRIDLIFCWLGNIMANSD